MSLGVEYGCKYTLTGPDGTVAVFNDDGDPNFVGILSPESSGLDSADVREDAADIVEGDGGTHGDFYAGRRPVILQGTILALTATQRNERVDRLLRASLALKGNATLAWQTVGGEPVSIKLRRQQAVRITKGFVKEFQVPMIAADPRIYSASSVETMTPSSVEKSPAEVAEVGYAGGTAAWSSPGNAKTSNNVYATVVLAKKAEGVGSLSEWIAASNFSFGIPANARPVEIEALIERKSSSAGDPLGEGISPVKAGSIGSEFTSAVVLGPGSDTVAAYKCSVSDVSAANANASNFGVAYRVFNESITIGYTVSVDLISLKLKYQKAVSISNSGNASSPPQIKITGPVIDPTITNETTGEVFKLNHTLTSGHYILVDFKAKTILEDGVTDLSFAFDFPNSEWWELQPGSNTITANAPLVEITHSNAWL